MKLICNSLSECTCEYAHKSSRCRWCDEKATKIMASQTLSELSLMGVKSDIPHHACKKHTYILSNMLNFIEKSDNVKEIEFYIVMIRP